MITDDNTFRFTSYGEEMTLKPEFDKYSNGRTAIALVYFDEEMQMWAPFAKITVNLPDQHLNEGEVFVKDWSENAPIVEHLLEQGWLVDTGREVLSGYVAPRVMRCAWEVK